MAAKECRRKPVRVPLSDPLNVFIKEDSKAEKRWGSSSFTGPFPIQSLPDDILIQCLARVTSRHSYAVLRAVCRSWRTLMANPLFYKMRNDLGLLRPCLLTLSRPPEQNRGEFFGEFFDPLTNSSHSFTCPWPGLRERRILPSGLAIFSCIAVGFDVFLLGGEHATHIYNPILNNWREGASMLEPRRDFACGVIGRKVYVCGGLNMENQRLRSVEVYDIDEDRWESRTSMPDLRPGCKGEVVNDRLYIVGDQVTFAPNRRSPPKMLIYDPLKDNWQYGKALPDDRWFFQTTSVQGKLCIVGGARKPYPATPLSQTCWASPLLYEEESDEWKTWLFLEEHGKEGGVKKRNYNNNNETSDKNDKKQQYKCSSHACVLLRDKALSHKVVALGLGGSLCVALAGEPVLFWCEKEGEGRERERNDEGKVLSCEGRWNSVTLVQGKGKSRKRLKHPWHGHVNGIAVVIHI